MTPQERKAFEARTEELRDMQQAALKLGRRVAQMRPAFEAMREALIHALRYVPADGDDERDMHDKARAALALAEEVNQQQRCAPCDDGECAIHPTSAQKR